MRASVDQNVIKYRNFKHIDTDAFKVDVYDLVVIPLLRKFANPQNIWEPLPMVASAELVAEMDNLLSSVLNNAAPYVEKIVHRRTNAKWWNYKCQQKKKELRKIERLWRKETLTINRQMYLNARREYHGFLKDERLKHIDDEMYRCDNDSRKYWQLLNGLLGRGKIKSVPAIPVASLSNTFNAFFSEKITKIRQSIVTVNHDSCPQQCQISNPLSSFGQVTGADLVLILRSMRLKPNRLDILPHWLFKLTLPVLMPLLVCLVNLILKTGLPLAYKHSIITPILKHSSLDPNDVKNYRPVSNFPTVVKIIENVIASKIMNHLEKNSLLDPYQFAYKRDHSCETVILSVLNDVYSAIDTKKISIVVLLDMSAAFDTVDHALLLNKLIKLGIDEDALEWLKIYLSDRFHTTQTKGGTSEALPLKMGVPQGSVLGPLLFTIYIMDLGIEIKKTGLKYYIYADDIQLIVHVEPAKFMDGIEEIGKCFEVIENWTARNYLQLNASKTEFIALGRKEQLKKIPNNEFSIKGNTFTLKSCVRNLGVLIDCELTFSKHVDNICRLAYANLRALHHIRDSLRSNQIAKFVHALVLSRIDSCPSVLYGIGKIQTKKLQRVLKAAFRMTFRLKKYDRVTESMKQKGWLTVEDRILLRLLTITYIAVNKKKPVSLSQLLSQTTTDQNLRSQSRGDLMAHGARTTIGGRAFKVVIPVVWRTVLPLQRFLIAERFFLISVIFSAIFGACDFLSDF